MISFISLCKMLYLLIIMPRLSKYEQCDKLIWKVGRRYKTVNHELKMNCFRQNNSRIYSSLELAVYLQK